MTDFEPSSDATDNENTAGPPKAIALTSTDVARCRNLMHGIVEHFTPVLFEPVCLILSIASIFVAAGILWRYSLWNVGAVHAPIFYPPSALAIFSSDPAPLIYLFDFLACDTTHGVYQLIGRQMVSPGHTIRNSRGQRVQTPRGPRATQTDRLEGGGYLCCLRQRKKRRMDNRTGGGVGEDGCLAKAGHGVGVDGVILGIQINSTHC